jgi:hypothetical protein
MPTNSQGNVRNAREIRRNYLLLCCERNSVSAFACAVLNIPSGAIFDAIMPRSSRMSARHHCVDAPFSLQRFGKFFAWYAICVTLRSIINPRGSSNA